MRQTLFLFLAIALSLPAAATDHFAAPTGTPSGAGTMASPWDLDTALGSPSGSQPASLLPGDTLWLRGGTYVPATGNGYLSHVTGTSDSPIVVRNYNGEHVTLSPPTSSAFVLAAYGAYTWYWGLELTTSNPTRNTGTPGGANPLPCVFGIYGPNIKAINNVVHDTAQGFSAYNSAPNLELTGNIAYYNGWVGPDRNHGHGIYLQNITGTKLIKDNFAGDNSDEGIQAYGSGGASIIGITLQENSIYNNSSWPYEHYQYNLVLGGGQTDTGNTVTGNLSFFTPSADYGYFNISQYTIATNNTATNNVLVGGYLAVSVEGEAGPFTFTGNTIYTRPTALREVTFGQFAGQTTAGFTWDNNTYYGNNVFFSGTYDGSGECCGSNSTFPNWQTATGFDAHSTWTASAPTGKWIYVKPNAYEAKRANITIYNWDLSATVNVDVSSVLTPGDVFVVQDVQNFYGPAVLSGTYAGGTIAIPMTGLTKAPIKGSTTPPHTAPLYGTFVVMSGSGGPPPPPTPAPPTGVSIIVL